MVAGSGRAACSCHHVHQRLDKQAFVSGENIIARAFKPCNYIVGEQSKHIHQFQFY